MNDYRKRGGCDFQSRQESIAFRRKTFKRRVLNPLSYGRVGGTTPSS